MLFNALFKYQGVNIQVSGQLLHWNFTFECNARFSDRRRVNDLFLQEHKIFGPAFPQTDVI